MLRNLRALVSGATRAARRVPIMNRATLNPPATASCVTDSGGQRAVRPGDPHRPTLEDGLRALQEASELAADIRVELTNRYVRLIEAVEALPENQPGADKSGRWRGGRSYWRFFEGGRFVTRAE